MTDATPPIIPGGVLITGRRAYALSRAIDREEIAANLDGLGVSERDRELAILALEAIESVGLAWKASMSGSGQDSGHVPDTVASSEQMERGQTISTTAAAERVGLTTRQIRRLAPSLLGGRRVSGVWQLDAAAVDHFARTRGT